MLCLKHSFAGYEEFNRDYTNLNINEYKFRLNTIINNNLNK